MPVSGPRSRGARAHPPPHQGCPALARRSVDSRLVLATQNSGGITGRGTGSDRLGPTHWRSFAPLWSPTRGLLADTIASGRRFGVPGHRNVSDGRRVIHARALGRHFGRRRALIGIDLELDRSGFLVVSGPN